MAVNYNLCTFESSKVQMIFLLAFHISVDIALNLIFILDIVLLMFDIFVLNGMP